MGARNFQDSIDSFITTPRIGMNKERAAGTDWKGDEVMECQPIYRKNELIIPEDSLKDFNEEQLRKMTAKEKLNRILELTSYSVKDDVESIQMINNLLEDILNEKIGNIGIAEYYDLIYSEM